MAYNIYCLQYFALVKADFFFICVYVFLFVLEMFKYIELVYLFSVLEVCVEIKKPVFVYYWLSHVLYISVHRCPCLRVCVTFCAVVSFLILDVDVFKEGLFCTLIFHRYSK